MKKLTITSYHKKRVEYDIEHNDTREEHFLNGRNKLENIFTTISTVMFNGYPINSNANYYSNKFTTTGQVYWTGNTTSTTATVNLNGYGRYQ